jgi:serine/threonine-protein kinase
VSGQDGTRFGRFADLAPTEPSGTPPAVARDRTGEVLAGRFELIAHLGSGGMGSVYRAHDRRLDDEVAIKLLHADLAGSAASLDLLRSEVKLARRVTSVNVARIHELVCDGDLWFLTMEYVDGVSLADMMRGGGRLPVARVIKLLGAVCDGLAAVHRAGVVHGDVKPANILVARDGRVVLSDFGVARFAGSRGDTREVVGTPAYMAPEQVTGDELDPRADLYALGVVAYELLAGELPFRGRNAIEVATARLIREAPALGDDYPEQLVAAVAAALARDPAERPASAEALRDALTRAPAAQPRTIESVDVVELYLDAQRLYRDYSRIARSVELFDQARRRAPDSGMVQAGYATALTRKWMMVGIDDDLAARAQRAVDRAVALAPELGETQLARAALALHLGDPVTAAGALRKAVIRAPGLADAHALAYSMLLEVDRPEAAEIHFRCALELDPRRQTLPSSRALARALRGDWVEADALLRGEIEPGSVALMVAARLAAYRGDTEALDRFRRIGEQSQDRVLPAVAVFNAIGAAFAGKLDLESVYALLPTTYESTSRRRFAVAMQVRAEVAGAHGDPETALEAIELSDREGRLIDILWLDRCPLIESARELPGFAEVRESVAARAAAVICAFGIS